MQPDQPIRFRFQPERPMPLIPAIHGRKSCIAIVGVGAVRRIGPGNRIREIANDLPMRKQKLRLRGVGELQWTQEEARSLKMRNHVFKMITQMLWTSSCAPRQVNAADVPYFRARTRRARIGHTKREELLRAGDRVGVAVSGGIDSVALLRLLIELRHELGIVLSVVHFNHKLRGAESDADQEFVENLAREHGLEFS